MSCGNKYGISTTPKLIKFLEQQTDFKFYLTWSKDHKLLSCCNVQGGKLAVYENSSVRYFGWVTDQIIEELVQFVKKQ